MPAKGAYPKAAYGSDAEEGKGERFPPRKILVKECSAKHATPNGGAIFVERALMFLFAAVFLCAIAGAAVGAVSFAAFLLGAGIGEIAAPGIAAFLLLAVPGLAFVAIEGIYYVRTFRFSLQDELVFSRSGVISPGYTMIPYENVQDVQLSEGLLEKLTRTASVTITTPASTLKVPYLERELAKGLRLELLARAEKHRGLAE